MKKILSLVFLFTCMVGCGVLPLKPGRAKVITSDGFKSEIKQSQNPKTPTTQKYERVTQSSAGVKTTERNEIVIGAAQKDTAREMAAKLGSLKGVVWIGVLVFLFGAASLFYPPLKLIVGSVTTSIAACAAGIALIILPSLIVGHELLIMGVGLGGLGLYWFSHRHGKLQGLVDANKNGIDDRKEKAP